MKFLAVLIGFIHVKRVVLSATFNLSEFIPSDYDKMVPPKLNEDVPVGVNVSLYVIQIRSVDETEMDFKMDILIRQTWQDRRLNFPPSTEHKKKVVLDPKWRDFIWTPDVWFKNALDTQLQQWEVPSVFYWLEKDMKVCFSGRVTLELSCDMDMHSYPHDTQTCGVDIMALMNPSKDLLLDWEVGRPVRMSRILQLPQFDIDDPLLDRCDSFMYDEKYSCIRASFSMSRRGGYFLINIYIPTILIVLMSMLTFWIPPEAVPARITLGVTSLLTIITKQYQSNMPSVSYIIALNIWLSSCVAFVFCSLLEYAIVISLLKNEKSKVSPVVSDPDKSEKSLSQRSSLKSAWKAKTLTFIETFSGHTMDHISRMLFPFFFIIFCIAYTSKYSN